VHTKPSPGSKPTTLRRHPDNHELSLCSHTSHASLAVEPQVLFRHIASRYRCAVRGEGVGEAHSLGGGAAQLPTHPFLRKEKMGAPSDTGQAVLFGRISSTERWYA
jgi:hypothetical protein